MVISDLLVAVSGVADSVTNFDITAFRHDGGVLRVDAVSFGYTLHALASLLPSSGSVSSRVKRLGAAAAARRDSAALPEVRSARRQAFYHHAAA